MGGRHIQQVILSSPAHLHAHLHAHLYVYLHAHLYVHLHAHLYVHLHAHPPPSRRPPSPPSRPPSSTFTPTFTSTFRPPSRPPLRHLHAHLYVTFTPTFTSTFTPTSTFRPPSRPPSPTFAHLYVHLHAHLYVQPSRPPSRPHQATPVKITTLFQLHNTSRMTSSSTLHNTITTITLVTNTFYVRLSPPIPPFPHAKFPPIPSTGQTSPTPPTLPTGQSSLFHPTHRTNFLSPLLQAKPPPPPTPLLQVTGTLQQIQQTQQSLTTATQASNPTLVTKQYNSPLPLYSQENVQEAMRMQTSPSHTPTINPSPTPANKPVQVILTPSKEYNPQSSATWRALQETDAPIDPEKVANYSALKEHDPIYSEVYTAPVAPKPGQRPPARTNALPGPRSPVSELLPPPMRPANEVMADSETRSFLSPPKTGPSAVLSAALAESKPVDQMTTDRVKIPIYEDDYALLQETYNPPRRPGGPKTNAIGGRKKIAQTAFFNKLMMDVLGE
ncbi:hypothetical protein Hamer_G023476 [Homarus americanus]|uniref:Zasp-like motif domain-containing protein n=1 Tax=Homarus americanus TaxID=6706 RepID=A0A8J5TL99_HOMAM|nr:hypothetical protein Hamer_G023476 [Homarus americanus]